MNKKELRSAVKRAKHVIANHPEYQNSSIEELFLKLAQKGQSATEAKSGPQKLPK